MGDTAPGIVGPYSPGSWAPGEPVTRTRASCVREHPRGRYRHRRLRDLRRFPHPGAASTPAELVAASLRTAMCCSMRLLSQQPRLIGRVPPAVRAR